MAYPNLYSDESIVLNAQNVKVKSVSFEAVLTTRRLILVDSKKHLIAPQEILLATLKEIETGENAIRDPTITLSIITNTGATRQMILTFSKLSGGDRHRECDEWVKALKQNMASAGQHPIMPGHAAPDEAYPSGTGEPGHVSVEAANIPATPSSLKKKIEIARPAPIKKIVDAPPTMPKPVETSSLPTGSFCNKCGSRVPPDSAFCNKCGTPVVSEADMEARIAAASAPAPASSIPQVQVQTPPAYGTGDKKDRPIEDVIHSIEPLIEDSVPSTTPYPLVAKQVYQPAQHPASVPEQPAAPAPEAPAEPSATPGVAWPVLGSAGGPVENQVSIPSVPESAPAAEPAAPAAPPVPPMPPAPGRSKTFLMIGVAVLVLIIIAAVFIFANPLGGEKPATTTIVPTAVPTTIATKAPSTPTMTYVPTATIPAAAEPAATPAGTTSSAGGQLEIPAQNVWVHIIYDGEYTGTYGIAGSVSSVSDKGEKLVQVATSDGIVVASVQKVDGSSDKLTVEVYKDGKLMQQQSTVAPKGIVEIQADLKPAATPTPTATATKIPVPTKTTAAANVTANATAAATTAA